MIELLLTLLPVAIAAAILPFWLIIVAMLLQNENGTKKALAFVFGTFVVRLLQGLVFGILLSDAGIVSENSNFIQYLLIVLGLIIVGFGIKKALAKKDDEKPTPAIIQSLKQATILKSFLNGFLLMGISVKHWVFTLSAISIISYSTLDYLHNYTAYVMYILFTQVLLYLLIVTAILYPERFDTLLEKISTKVAPYSKILLAGISVFFGVWLILKGL